MRATRTRQLLVLLASLFAIALLGTVPASAAPVDCADLRTQRAAQSYLQGPSGDASVLDVDGDGRACEGNTPTSDGRWTVLGLGAIIGAVLVASWVATRRRSTRPAAVPATFLAPAGEKERVLGAAPSGSLAELARALRRTPYGDRMPLLEEHARTHGLAPQDVLDSLVAVVDELALQRWALTGYGPPSRVRMLFCPCVGAARNFRLDRSADGSHAWTCASCGLPAVPRVGAGGRHKPIEQQPQG
jgi:hypothetical protein